MSYYIVQNSQCETIINKSKFLSFAFAVNDISEIERTLKEMRKKYYDATHVCYGYILDESVKKFSDDGEPQGTAGQPILEVLAKANVRQTLVVVVRYFGGIKLGVGGLVRAYTSATKKAISQLIKYDLCDIYSLTLSFSDYRKVEKSLQSSSKKVLNINYSENVKLIVAVKDENLIESLSSLTKSNLDITLLCSRYEHIDEN